MCQLYKILRIPLDQNLLVRQVLYSIYVVHAFRDMTDESLYIYFLLVQLFMWMGLPQVITSDQFNNKLDKKIMALLGIRHHLTAPYHPQVF